MKDRYGLLQRGLFPETLPPCFTSTDIKRALVGLVRGLNQKALYKKREADYVRYNGTKHDGSRRFFGSPNPIPYFYVASFIAEHWPTFEQRFASSPFAVSQPRLGKDTDDRPVIIPSLSELTTVASKRLGHAAHILKTDIAQFFPSIYTHSIPWSAHGIKAAKEDQNLTSSSIVFNKLDFFVRNCQLGETRGVLVGPDAFRLITEFIAAGLDADIHLSIKAKIVGAARHVDDFYIGLSGQPEALEALSALRDVLQRYHLNINDNKTEILLGTEPLNDIWAQELRQESRRLRRSFNREDDDVILFVTKAMSLARNLKTDSPLKIAFRTLDQIRAYEGALWEKVEPYVQRAMFHHPHCIDYAALLVAKRAALNRTIDKEGWRSASLELLVRHLSLNHHHEVVWLTWLLLVANLHIPDDIVEQLSKNSNAHIRSLIVAAYMRKRIGRRPPIRLGNKLPTTDESWLLNLVARATGYSHAPFTGAFSAEFEHLASKRIRLIDFEAHLKAIKKANTRAISRTRYGYDSDDDDDDDDDQPF